MKLQSKYADLVLNLLVAVAISLVVNFSYVLLMLVDLNSDSQPRPSDQRAVERPDEGVLSVHPDGYGYLVYENGDSVYVPTRRMRWLEIAPGDRIVADLMPPRSEKAHPMLAEIRTRNGAEFDYSKLYNGPSKMTELLLQLFYYLVVSFVMLSILTSVRRNYSMSRFVRRCLATHPHSGTEQVQWSSMQARVVVQADELLLEHVVNNLLANALVWSARSAAPARVQVAVDAQGEMARLSVADNGPGVAPEAREPIFNAFFSTHEGGMGMGLAICRSIVEAHHGRIDVDNDPVLGGARFTVWLPLTRPTQPLSEEIP